MSALMNSIGLSDDNTSVTKISANARIDYILRFSKQAILVIDESAEQSAQITNQFIATIPEQHNAAYISLSNQFSDIQIRCRIIEQLSAGELFDPEVSLAVSIINLAKKPQQAISIVLDNSQHLSLQILHEVSQLTAIAKKANLVINVIMFGSLQAGIKVQANKNLFHNKLTMLSAQSGQLISANSTIFQRPKVKWYSIKLNKWLLSAFVLLFGLAAAVIMLLQQDSFNFTPLPKVQKNDETTLNAALTEPQHTVLNKEVDINIAVANPSDIYSSLLVDKTQKNAVQLTADPAPATPNDIMLAMTSLPARNKSSTNIDSEITVDIVQEQQTTVNSTSATDAALLKETSIKLAANYYLSQKSGFVIQIAAFDDIELANDYMMSLAKINSHVYQRLLNNNTNFVITSSIYADKLSAKQALLTLPESIIARQPWIKSLKLVKREINAFQDSQ